MSQSRIRTIVVAFLTHKYLPFILAALGALLILPTLWQGLMIDDLILRERIHSAGLIGQGPRGTGWLPAWSEGLVWTMNNLFSWIGRGSSVNQLEEMVITPWWSCDSILISFWRPIPALFHWLDYTLWPDAPVLMHAQSILWLALVVCAATFMYRRLLLNPAIAGFAALLFTLEDGLYMPKAWVANRHALIAFLLGVLALAAHHHWRDKGSRIFGIASAVLLLMTLFSSEQAVGILAYFVSYALFMDRSGRWKAFLSLIPCVVVTALWRLLYVYMGHGLSCTGLYVDPTKDLFRFIPYFVENAPVLLGGLLSGLTPIMYNNLGPFAATGAWVAAVVFIVICVTIIWPVFRNEPKARFWAVGVILSLVPAGACIMVNDRLLFYVSFGLMALIALLVGTLFEKREWAPASRIWRVFAWGLCLLLIVIHIPLAIVGHIVRPYVISYFKNQFLETLLPMTSPPLVDNRPLVVINAPNPCFFVYLPFMRLERKAPIPRTIRMLAPAYSRIQVTRIGERTVTIRSIDGDLLSVPNVGTKLLAHSVYSHMRLSTVFRPPGLAMEPGYKVKFPDADIEVLEVNEEGSPRLVSAQFNTSLDDSSRVFLQWNWKTNRYQKFEMPRIHSSVIIDGPNLVR